MKNGQKWPEEFGQAIDLLALKPRLTADLINATTDYLLAQTGAEKMPELTGENMPLKRTKDIEKTSYISAIAFKLQIPLQKTPAEIAQGINSRIKSGADFTVYVRAGWIQFELTELGLANWLQHLSQWNPPNPDYHQTGQKIDTKDTKLAPKLDSKFSPKLETTNNLFLLEYTHARCCSLLRLGDREQLIKLSEHSSDWQIIKPSPIPWLNEQNQLRLNSLTERRLISRLITTLDTLSTGKNEVTCQQILKLATELSQDLLTFYAANRIWNETKTENLALAQARLGLILTTQIVLKLLLEKGLGILPPQQM